MRDRAELPEQDRVMRYVPLSKLLRDGNDEILGCLPMAFQLRPGEIGLSVNWIEYFQDAPHREHACVWALRRNRKAGKRSGFAIATNRAIRDACLPRDIRVRIVHDPLAEEPAHSVILNLPPEDLLLLSALADEAFATLLRNADVPSEPSD